MAVRIKGNFKKFEGGLKASKAIPASPGFSNTPISGSWSMGQPNHIDSTSSEYVMGTGDYQYDFWMRPTVFPGGGYYHSVVEGRTAGGQNQIGFGIGPGGTAFGVQLTINEWVHIVFARKNGHIKNFIDGVEVADSANTSNFTSNRIRFGGPYNSPNSAWAFGGQLSNIRVIKGTPIYYDNNFTPLKTDATVETGTVLLTARGNGFADESGFGHTFSNSGVVQDLVNYPS